jgi:hypothetical protein
MATTAELEQVVQDALERYWRAVELADGVRRAWEDAEMPLTEVLANGVLTESPLLKLLRGCERDCERFARAIPRPKGQSGRPAEAVFRAMAEETPSARLRQLLEAVPDR